MGHPSLPPPPINTPPPPPLPPPAQVGAGAGGGCQVRCAGCKMVLTLLPGLTEFVCPTCHLPQKLPPKLMRANQAQSQAQAQQQRNASAQGIDPTKIQLSCANCKALLNVPHGLSRFNCPQCLVNLAVDLSKIGQFLPPVHPSLPPEEVNETTLMGTHIGTTLAQNHESLSVLEEKIQQLEESLRKSTAEITNLKLQHEDSTRSLETRHKQEMLNIAAASTKLGLDEGIRLGIEEGKRIFQESDEFARHTALTAENAAKRAAVKAIQDYKKSEEFQDEVLEKGVIFLKTGFNRCKGQSF